MYKRQVLTLSALVILSSGQLDAGLSGTLQGTALAQAAFNQAFGSFGNVFVAVCMLFFAFSTIIGWYFFGESNVKALFGPKATRIYAAIVIICLVIGSALKVNLVWRLSDPVSYTHLDVYKRQIFAIFVFLRD